MHLRFATPLLAALTLLSGVTLAQAVRPRRSLPKGFVRTVALPASGVAATESQRLVVKFADGLRARVDAAGELRSESGGDLSEAHALAARLGATFAPLIRLPHARLAALEERAAQRTGAAAADLAGLFIVRLPDDSPRELEAAGRAFESLDAVEFATIEALGLAPPSSGDIPPTTPNLVAMQVYRGPDPGMNVDFAWNQGLQGQGIRLSDCEYGWIATHEDLAELNTHPEPGQTVSPLVINYGWDEHGTAVLGETSAVENAFGCSGIVTQASVYTYPEWTVEEGFRRATAITHAIAGSAEGDVVLLEMQTIGPGGSFGPAELDPAIWLIVKTGTDAGVVVVGAAGNGNQDLDGPFYGAYQALGDSGAIIVGAGSANIAHAKLSFSTFGSRVNVQGWGEAVFTLGYGTFATYGGDKNQQYSSTFSGTSSASPFIAAACVALQQRAKQQFNAPLSPLLLRQLLSETGIPQSGGGGSIGPFPDLAAALMDLPSLPQISSHPKSATVCIGLPVSFSVQAPGATGLQWRKNGVMIPGATAHSYMIASVQPTDAAVYDVVVMKGIYELASHPAILTAATSTTVYGDATPGCFGPQTLVPLSCPMVGNSAFQLSCKRSPSNSVGFLIVGTAPNATGVDYFGNGLGILVDPILSTELLGYSMPSNSAGTGTASTPIPNDPALLGKTYYAQAIWFWGSTCALPTAGFSATRGLRIGIAP